MDNAKFEALQHHRHWMRTQGQTRAGYRDKVGDKDGSVYESDVEYLHQLEREAGVRVDTTSVRV